MGNSFLAECNKGISETEYQKGLSTIQHVGKSQLNKKYTKPELLEKRFQSKSLSCPQRSAQIDKIYQRLKQEKPISYSIQNKQILEFNRVRDLKQFYLKQMISNKLPIQKHTNHLFRRNSQNLQVELTPQSSQTNENDYQNEINIKKFFLKIQNQRETSFSSEMQKNIIRNRSSSQSFSDFNHKDGLSFLQNPDQIVESESFSIFFKDYIHIGYLNPSGKPHGPGQLYHLEKNSQTKDLLIFIEAEFLNGSISTDDMIVIFRDESFYRGGFHQSAFHGKGHLKMNNNFQLMGNFAYGLLEGKGKATYPDGGTYQGLFQAGIREGKGKLVWKSQKNTTNQFPLEICYEGFFKNDKMNGLGYLKTPNYEYWGPFYNNMKQGKGTIKFKDGNKFEGWFEKDQINGYGQLHYANGQVEKGTFPISKDQQ